MALAPQTYGSANADGDVPSSPHGDTEALLLNVKDPEVDKADTNSRLRGSRSDLEQAEVSTGQEDAKKRRKLLKPRRRKDCEGRQVESEERACQCDINMTAFARHRGSSQLPQSLVFRL